MTAARAANLGLKFVLELCMLAALAYWGARAGGSVGADVVLAVIAPLAAAVIWGLYAAPRARRRLRPPWRIVLELAVFAVAAVSLAAAGADTLAIIFAALVAVNAALLAVWGQE